MTSGEVTTAAPSIIPPTETAIEALRLMQGAASVIGQRLREVKPDLALLVALGDGAQARRARHRRPMNELGNLPSSLPAAPIRVSPYIAAVAQGLIVTPRVDPRAGRRRAW